MTESRISRKNNIEAGNTLPDLVDLCLSGIVINTYHIDEIP